MYQNYFKRLFDFLIALIALLLFSPIFILVTIGLFFANQGKPFFFQIRPGKNEKLFRIVKFKTMNDKTDARGNLLSDAERLTPIGAFVRKTSLDEIPQLLNVIKGDMSLIGPRPLLVQYLPLYNAEQKKRHNVRPGITGWAQVNGRNAISWEQKFAYDVWYVEHCSLLLDLKILLRTIQKVVQSEGINANQEVTMEPFRGNHKKKLIMDNIAIIGVGGFGREVKFLLDEINKINKKFNILGFYDDADELESSYNGLPYLGKIEKLNLLTDQTSVVLGIGDPKIKQKIISRLTNPNLRFPTIIHPSVIVSNDDVNIGEGTIICAGTIITCNIEIGSFVTLNLMCTVGHDTKIGDYSSFMPSVNISGDVLVEDGVYVGTGAKIINQLTIGQGTIVGAGAVVSKSLPPSCTAVGIPAKPIKFH